MEIAFSPIGPCSMQTFPLMTVNISETEIRHTKETFTLLAIVEVPVHPAANITAKQSTHFQIMFPLDNQKLHF